MRFGSGSDITAEDEEEQEEKWCRHWVLSAFG